MRITSKPALLTVPVVMFITLVAVLALWATGNIGANGGGGGTGASSDIGLVWNVEYWHRNADGDLLAYKKDHNAFTANGKEMAMERLIKVGAGNLADTSTTPQLIEADAYNKIVLQTTDDEGDSIIESAKIALLMDGGGTGDANPMPGSFSDGGGDGTGDVRECELRRDERGQEMGRRRIPTLDTFEKRPDEGDGVVHQGRRALQGDGNQRAVGDHSDP